MKARPLKGEGDGGAERNQNPVAEEQAEGEGEVKAAVITESSDVKEWEPYLWGSHFLLCAGFLGFGLFLTPFLSAHKFHPGVGGVGVTGGGCHMCHRSLEFGDGLHPCVVGFGGYQHPCVVGSGGLPASLHGGAWGITQCSCMVGFGGDHPAFLVC